ncbi:endonuclease/exonuclease/phosphatase family protein [Salinivibrio kushneri]|uniref:Endonuclease/exonuclease/phosphatase family protein n=1 Tax=Salinivibrio kushneri TaxID=1908198 RepID=A0AA47LSU3_9GAMM|nr:endonuclease/exonuclease/phosphatase family protein [Salinivibrio kushneri]WBA10189.1 endonuclease/exonuclease/phosphatase family protein [Salinivibrio kushneri]
MATWNFEWLTLKDDQRAGIRDQDDYQQLSSIFVQLAPDVLAFQEVDSPEALARVVPAEDYTVYFSDRYADVKTRAQSQQLTGIAVRKGWKVEDPKDLRQIALPDFFGVPSLRYGTYVVVTPPNQEPIHILSIHLKSGCFKQTHASRSCKKLSKQFGALADWVIAHGDKNILIAGDFNRYISDKQDPYWQQFRQTLLENTSAPTDIVNVTQSVRARCKARRYNWRTQTWNQVMYSRLVDHILVSESLASQWQYSYQHHFAYHRVMNYRLSDHCPVVATFKASER